MDGSWASLISSIAAGKRKGRAFGDLICPKPPRFPKWNGVYGCQKRLKLYTDIYM